MNDFQDMSFSQIRQECEREALLEINEQAEEDVKIEVSFSRAKGTHIFDIEATSNYSSDGTFSVYFEDDTFYLTHSCNIQTNYRSIAEMMDAILAETMVWEYEFILDKMINTFENAYAWIKEIIEWQMTRSWRTFDALS